MGAKIPRAVAVALALAALAAAGARSWRGIDSRAARMNRIPHTILWAWERREDLSFIDPARIGVAYLAGTITLSGERVAIHPRRQPLIVPPRTVVFPVIRIESEWNPRPSLSREQRRNAVSAIVRMAGASPAAIQVDFDAARSQRAFYRALLVDLRGQVPDAVPLSMTALPSWCVGDVWIGDLPVDEAVPMLFRMGIDGDEIRAYVSGGGEFIPDSARSSVGLAADEPIAGFAPRGRVYLFSPRAWTVAEVRRALREVGR